MTKIKLLLVALTAFVSSSALAQKSDSIQVVPVDKSVADIAYYPSRIPFERDTNKTPLAKVIYSRPLKNGREVWGALINYGQVWRTGANESTEVKFYKDVTINGTLIKAGAYSIFTIPDRDKWTVILNAQTDKWGAYFYDKSKDVARIQVPVKSCVNPIEAFTILFKDDKDSAKMIMAWDKTYVELPLKF
ncbi:DUF2911 domain-containing protein [Solitalea koreensis]|uniref:DUF2911 domain-containing protein n=1 Tax=Solitalea koreensis TaxID=543615 RepID=A0A521EGQ5_9SPHI|nr:DUF2911 domain-containing protein [Solitalea koreensis]SMO82651.1 Protein of unknown function [Solitalea koreensis]